MTHLGCGGRCYMGYVANFIVFLAVEKLLEMVTFWPSYSKLNLARFLGHSVD